MMSCTRKISRHKNLDEHSAGLCSRAFASRPIKFWWITTVFYEYQYCPCIEGYYRALSTSNKKSSTPEGSEMPSYSPSPQNYTHQATFLFQTTFLSFYFFHVNLHYDFGNVEVNAPCTGVVPTLYSIACHCAFFVVDFVQLEKYLNGFKEKGKNKLLLVTVP